MGPTRTLLVEGPKDVEGAYSLLGTLQEHGIPLLQVGCFHGVMQCLKRCLCLRLLIQAV